MTPRRYVVVGAGIVGLAVARELLLRRPGLDLAVLEQEEAVGMHQTGHNSGVVHSGLYYRPGSLKARLCTDGARRLHEYCRARTIPYRQCGKLVVAVDGEEAGALRALYERGIANGLSGLRLVDHGGVRDIEPHAGGVLGLHVPSTAVVDFAAVAASLAGDVEDAGGSIRLGRRVEGFAPVGDQVALRCGDETITADRVVLCAGLEADRVARQAGDGDDPRIVPFRGEYFHLPEHRRPLVRALIYPVPDPRTPFLGVHLSRHVDGTVSVGPNAVLALARHGYRRRDLVLEDCRDILAWPGSRAMARRYWRTGVAEMLGSASRRVYLGRARRYLPELELTDLGRPAAGVRAQAVDRRGTLVDDFVVHEVGPVVAVRNAPSPAATSCLAIAAHICDHYLTDGARSAGR